MSGARSTYIPELQSGGRKHWRLSLTFSHRFPQFVKPFSRNWLSIQKILPFGIFRLQVWLYVYTPYTPRAFTCTCRDDALYSEIEVTGIVWEVSKRLRNARSTLFLKIRCLSLGCETITCRNTRVLKKCKLLRRRFHGFGGVRFLILRLCQTLLRQGMLLKYTSRAWLMISFKRLLLWVVIARTVVIPAAFGVPRTIF